MTHKSSGAAAARLCHQLHGSGPRLVDVVAWAHLKVSDDLSQLPPDAQAVHLARVGQSAPHETLQLHGSQGGTEKK